MWVHVGNQVAEDQMLPADGFTLEHQNWQLSTTINNNTRTEDMGIEIWVGGIFYITLLTFAITFATFAN